MADPTGYRFPIQNSDGTPSSTRVDLADVMVLKEQFFQNKLYAMGSGSSGQFGVTPYGYNSYSSPIQIGTLTNWRTVALSGQTQYAITINNELWSNGGADYNEPAGTTSYQRYGTDYWKTCAAGTNSYFLGIKIDGSLWAAGRNNYGQLGNNTSNPSFGTSLTQIGSLKNWKLLFAGTSISAAIKTDGTLWMWGQNANFNNTIGYGCLGNGTTNHYSSPVQIGSLTDWKQVSCGYTHTAATSKGGTLSSWGYNDNGQLGNGTTVNYSSPIQIGLTNSWKQVSCKYKTTAAIKTDGTLWAWGYNNNGQLGNGTTTNYSSPIQIGSLTNWKHVACGYYHTAAIKTDGTLWAWGVNGSGQLGNQTTVNYSSPIQVGSLTNWTRAVLASSYSFILQSPDLP